MSKVKFTVEGTEYCVVEPSVEVKNESNKIYNTALYQAISDGYLLNCEVEKILRERHVLEEDDDAKIEEVNKRLKSLEKELRSAKRNGRRMSKEEGKAIALEMRSLRNSLREIGRTRGDLASKTAESYADNIRFQHWLFQCTKLAESGERYWKTYEDFLADQDSTVALEAMKYFISILTKIDPDYEKRFYENGWLIRQGFMNDALQFVRPDGRTIDEAGRLIDAKSGRFVGEDGQFVDTFGNTVDEAGNLVTADEWATVETAAADKPVIKEIKEIET